MFNPYSQSDSLDFGSYLANTSMKDGGWKELIEHPDFENITDDVSVANTAVLLENGKRWLGSKARAGIVQQNNGLYALNEDTMSQQVGGFSDYLFPLIRAGWPSNPINDLVSVQATNRRHATILYWNWVYGTTKGDITQGQSLADANRGRLDAQDHYTSERIRGEDLGTAGTGTTGPVTGTLAYHTGGGIRPGTVLITIGGQNFFDDGNGGFSNSGSGSDSIDYRTGAFSITGNSSFSASDAVTAEYRWNSEGSPDLPEIEVAIESTTAETEKRALRLRSTVEAFQDAQNETGRNIRDDLMLAASNEVQYETARQVIRELWNVTSVVATFPVRPPQNAGYNQQDHFRDIIFPINVASGVIENTTQKGTGTWLVVDDLAGTVIQSLPSTLFQPAPRPSNPQGIHFIGMLKGYRVYKDIFLRSLPGASEHGNILMGFKGEDFMSAGFVMAPYHMLYTTEDLTLADFTTQKGLASRYATKMVNPHMYTRISLVRGGGTV